MAHSCTGEWWIHRTGDDRVRLIFKTDDGERAILDTDRAEARLMFCAGAIASSQPKTLGGVGLHRLRIAEMRRRLRAKAKTLPNGI